MIVTSRFVFLHLHKSGGTFVNQFLLRHFPDARLIGYHLPRQYLPAECAALPIFGLVRNPWDYYVSWYAFQAARNAPNPLYRVASEDGRLEFNATIENLLNLGQDRARLERLAEALPEEFTNRGINLTRRCLASFAGSPHGFYSLLFRRMFGDCSGVTCGRMEALRADLAAFLHHVGVQLDAREREFIEHHAPLNTSLHEPYAGMYDDGLRDLVARKDALVIERFGYEFGAPRPAADGCFSGAGPSAGRN